MKVLIGTPHQVKDYSMERWLENVSKLQKRYPARLIPCGQLPHPPHYVEQVKKYCKKYDIKEYTITHIDFDQGMTVNAREYLAWFNFDMGCTLVTRECLEKHGFLPKQSFGHWQGEDEFYKIRVLKGGGNYAEVEGLIEPIYHLSE